MIRKHSPVPLYFKVMIDLQDKIFSGEWLPGAKIPAEVDLAKQVGVSVITIRQAMSQLVDEGYIRRERPKGSFVRWNGPVRQSVSLDIEADDLAMVDPAARFKFLRLDHLEPARHWQERLGLKGDEKITRIVRVRLSNEKPLAYVIAYTPFRFGSVLPKKELSRRPLLHALETFAGAKISEVNHRVGAVLSDSEVSLHLEIAPGSPVLHVERDYLSKKEIVMVSVSYFRSDLFRYELKLKRKLSR